MLTFEVSVFGELLVISTASGVTRSILALVIQRISRLRNAGFQNALGVADTAEAEMADIRLGCDKGHRHAVADLALAQIGIGEKREFIGRAEA